jgi:hypothetical protein
MNPDVPPVTSTACPPHHWLIERMSPSVQHWTCRRCGTAEERQDVPVYMGYRPRGRLRSHVSPAGSSG